MGMSHAQPAPNVSESRTVLAVHHVSKSYAGVHALKRVSFDLRSGEVHALVGENGAGKSTLTKIMTGNVVADSGTLEVFGNQLVHNNPSLARSLGIAAIYQQPSLFPHLTVAENIALALESSTTWRVDWNARRTQAIRLLKTLHTVIDPERLASSLSMAEQQIVEIAKAIGADAKILLMDEPTALLTTRETQQLFQIIHRLRTQGVGIIYISHRLEEILALADRITVLRDGETIDCRQANTVDRSKLIELMVGRSIASVFPKRTVPLGKVALHVSNLNHPAMGLRSISLSIRRGEIFGLAGLVGSGRTELATTLFGLTPCSSEVLVAGVPARITSPADAIRLGLAYLPEDRRQHGVILDMAIASNVSMANLDAVSRHGLINSRAEQQFAASYVQSLQVKASSVTALAGTLSGGNQQKVALARWLATNPQVMILDEPTQGVDVGSKSEIHELIVQLAERGMAILLISSELPEILGMSDRIGVMRNGRIAGILSREQATQASVLSLALGQSSLHEANA